MKRRYGLFVKDDTGRWVRVMPEVCLYKTQAVSFWQNALLSAAFGGKQYKLGVVQDAERV